MWLKLFARALNLKEILETVIFKRILVIDSWGISCQIALIWMPLDFIDDQSTLVQVMAWCRQATSHYLSECWPLFCRYMAAQGHNVIILAMICQFKWSHWLRCIDQLKTKRHHDANFGLQWRQSWHHYNSDHIVAFALGTEYHISSRKQMLNERIP